MKQKLGWRRSVNIYLKRKIVAPTPSPYTKSHFLTPTSLYSNDFPPIAHSCAIPPHPTPSPPHKILHIPQCLHTIESQFDHTALYE